MSLLVSIVVVVLWRLGRPLRPSQPEHWAVWASTRDGMSVTPPELRFVPSSGTEASTRRSSEG
ncbi:MAG: hypothetical protein A2V77_01745 [Anaeromyxobacter sp. RBG_16_69_14]|nr:MAG: hypothetical protein A2V77_01745 [Anaeromyxobacter sp. RBG_16_69_14]